MSHLSVEVINKPCAFVLEIENPVETLKKLAMFFQDRHIVIDNLQMHCYRNGDEATLIHPLPDRERQDRKDRAIAGTIAGDFKVRKDGRKIDGHRRNIYVSIRRKD